MIRQLLFKSLLPLLALGVLPVSAQTAGPEYDQQMRQYGLERVRNPKAALAYAKPGANWNKFKTIYLMPLVVPDEARKGRPNASRSDREGSYILRDKEVQLLKDIYDKEMREEITRDGRFKLVSTPQSDTLIVASQIANIWLAAPIEETRRHYAGNSKTYTPGGGSIALSSVFADGETDEIVARIVDQEGTSDRWRLNNRASNYSDLTIAFANWANDLTGRLAKIQSGKVKIP